jgi:hypothetical protein
MKKISIVLLGVISAVYLINPTAGVFEFLPDNIPFIGNLDEGLAAYVLISCVQYLRGKKIGLFDTSKSDKPINQQNNKPIT